MEFVLGMAVGIGIGWVVFKRPEWAEGLLAKVRR